jgi:hypothetical protein
MPLRTALILFGLFTGCLVIVLLAWASGSEFYVFLPSRWFTSIHPPTHPSVVLILLAACVALYLYSQHYALLFFTALLGGLVLGSLVGYGVFAWTPTVAQLSLTLAMIAEAAYGWTIQNDYLDD